MCRTRKTVKHDKKVQSALTSALLVYCALFSLCRGVAVNIEGQLLALSVVFHNVLSV